MRGRARIVIGVGLIVAGVALLVVGIVQAAASDPDLEAEAVDTARTVEGGLLDVDAPRAGDYTIYVVVRTGELGEDEGFDVQREAVHDVSCVVERPGAERLTIRGDRQGNGQSTDDAASVGWFSTGAGRVRATCATDGGTDRTVLLVEGRPSIWAGGVVAAVGGSMVGILGGALVWWGVRARATSAAGRAESET